MVKNSVYSRREASCLVPWECPWSPLSRVFFCFVLIILSAAIDLNVEPCLEHFRLVSTVPQIVDFWPVRAWFWHQHNSVVIRQEAPFLISRESSLSPLSRGDICFLLTLVSFSAFIDVGPCVWRCCMCIFYFLFPDAGTVQCDVL